MSVKLRLAPDGSGAEVELRQGQSIRIPLDHRAGPLLERILVAREAAERTNRIFGAAVGTQAAPLQSMVDEYLRRGGSIHVIKPTGPKAPKGPEPKVNIELGELFPEFAGAGGSR